MAATAGVGVAGFGVGTYVRFKRIQKLRSLLALNPALLAQALKKGGSFSFKIPKLKTKPKTMEQQLDDNLRAFIVMADLVCAMGGYNMYERAISGPNEFDPSTNLPWATEPGVGTKQTGFLYGALPVWMSAPGENSEYARSIWDDSPFAAVSRSAWLVTYGLAYVSLLAEQGHKMPVTGDNDEGPDLGQLAMDYAQDAAVSYLAAAIPGGVVVLAIADELGIGWTNTTGRHDVPLQQACSNDRYLATITAEELIAHIYANPAPAIIGTAAA